MAINEDTILNPTDQIMSTDPISPEVWSEETFVDDIQSPEDFDPTADIESEIAPEALRIESLIMITNLAPKQSEDVLSLITTKVFEGYDVDLRSRAEWESSNKAIIELVKLEVKKKTYAGSAVANVKYPLITNACIQFAARAYPEMVKGNEVVKGKVIGKDPDNLKFDRAQRLCEFMSYQVLNDMEDWEDGVDQLLFTLPAIGCAFKKSYYDSLERRNVSKMVFADDLVVNYFTESLARVPRITHRIYLYQNEIIERINSGVFSQFDISELGQAVSDKTSDIDDETPHLFLEQHRWYDLDGDGYQEPYIVTVHYQSQKLVRIAPRFASDGVIRGENGKIIRIVPEEYFTRYIFMPAIDGGFYGMGFGSLLQSSNEAVNTIINQLLDSGTLSNRQSGFLGRGLRIGRGKTLELAPGEWKPVESTGDDLRKNIFPIPVREPSTVLFSLLGMMIEACKEMSGVTEILSGQSPGANVPAESVLALIEQGLQVYSAIHKRIHRAQYKEFKKLRRLNALYLDQMFYSTVLDDDQANVQADFSTKDFDIVPVSDPNSTTMMQRLMKAKAMLELRGQGLNDQEILRRYLLAMDTPDVEQLFTSEEDQQPNPMEQLTMAELQAKVGKLQAEMAKIQAETQKIMADIQSSAINDGKVNAGIINDERKIQLEAAKTLDTMQKSDSGYEQRNIATREYGLESNNIEARETGGPVNPNQPYLVGEDGPEVIVPDAAGTVIPNKTFQNIEDKRVFRNDKKTYKGNGWLGKQKSLSGNDMTEFSIGLNIGGQEMDIPTLVPGLTADELNFLLTEPATDKIPKTIIDKAAQHALEQLRNGKSVFKDSGNYNQQ